jgi:hypothetical protein
MAVFRQYLASLPGHPEIQIYSFENSRALFELCCEYGLLEPVGKRFRADLGHDEYMYRVAAKPGSQVPSSSEVQSRIFAYPGGARPSP